MSKAEVIDLMAVVSLILLAAAVLVAVVAVLTRWGPFSLPAWLGRAALPAAAAVAVAATGASLWLSEVANFIPCEYCWYQRITMYPLAVILVIAVVLRDSSIWRYGLPLALIGLLTSARHYWLQENPESSSCVVGVPCSVRYVEEFGVVSIPWMAGVCFLLIGILLLVARSVGRREPS